MNKLKNIVKQIHQKILLESSSERRINYLRKQGIKIGRNCIINTMSFSSEPFLIEIGNDVGISSGTVFITHDGTIRCFYDELQGGIFGKIK